MGKPSLTISRKPVGVWAGSQPLILAVEQSGLLTRIAATESVSWCQRMKKTAFIELESATSPQPVTDLVTTVRTTVGSGCHRHSPRSLKRQCQYFRNAWKLRKFKEGSPKVSRRVRSNMQNHPATRCPSDHQLFSVH